MSNADKPAMPLHDDALAGYEGLTKREHFAGLAMQSLLAHYGTDGADECASYAVEYANALLKALEPDND
jgi:hypothetical protein|tara:strand:- start:241 stop:447 length:207 start_codon:yes stop_codon:yes gene_type:complete